MDSYKTAVSKFNNANGAVLIDPKYHILHPHQFGFDADDNDDGGDSGGGDGGG